MSFTASRSTAQGALVEKLRCQFRHGSQGMKLERKKTCDMGMTSVYHQCRLGSSENSRRRTHT